MIGQFVDVLVTEVMANSLRGRVLDTDDLVAAGDAREICSNHES